MYAAWGIHDGERPGAERSEIHIAHCGKRQKVKNCLILIAECVKSQTWTWSRGLDRADSRLPMHGEFRGGMPKCGAEKQNGILERAAELVDAHAHYAFLEGHC